MDTSQNFKVDRKDMKAEGILMHREQNIIAVRASTGENAVIQVSQDHQMEHELIQIKLGLRRRCLKEN